MSTEKLEQEKAIIEIQENWPNLKAQGERLVVDSPRSQVEATEIRSSLKVWIDKIAVERKKRTVVLDELKKNVMATARKYSDPLEELDLAIAKKLIAYQKYLNEEKRKAEEKAAKEEAEKAAELARLAKQAEKAETFEDIVKAEEKIAEVQQQKVTLAPEVRTLVHGTGGCSTGFREPWVHEITDTNKVPREYCSPDNSLIRAAIKKGIRTITGVRIYQEMRTTRRG